MDKMQFLILLKEIARELKNNKKGLDLAIKKELSKGNVVKYEKIEKIISDFESLEMPIKPENKKIAVSSNGRPEISLTYMLDSIIYNNKLTLCVDEMKEINEILYTVVVNSLLSCKLMNQWLNYNPTFNEIYLRDNESKFDKIVYIGDYFGYQRFNSFFKKEVEYNNYGYIKLFMDKKKYSKEYDKIIKYAYIENISIEYYNDVDDFLNESKDNDYSVVFGEVQEINKIRKGLKGGSLLINAFPYEEYKFEVNR